VVGAGAMIIVGACAGRATATRGCVTGDGGGAASDGAVVVIGRVDDGAGERVTCVSNGSTLGVSELGGGPIAFAPEGFDDPRGCVIGCCVVNFGCAVFGGGAAGGTAPGGASAFMPVFVIRASGAVPAAGVRSSNRS